MNDFKVYGQRWLILGSYCLVNWAQCVSQYTLSAYKNDIPDAYGISKIEANFESSVSLIIFFPGFLCATYLYNNSTLRTV